MKHIKPAIIVLGLTFSTVAFTEQVAPNNSQVNESITENQELTALDQGNSELDLKLSAEIRKAITSQDGLSIDARNIKIISRNGVVVLKGPVKNSSEKARIDAIAKRVAKSSKVVNEISVR